MSTLTMPARPTPDADLRPVLWRNMAWVTWRQHRLAFAGVLALFGAAGVYLLITGLRMHHAYATVSACRPASSGICVQVAHDFLDSYAPGVGYVVGLLHVIPALIGAFAGAPVLAREFETGTFRYTWTQGFGRTRWTVAKLTSLAVAVMITAGAFTVLVTWYYQPLIGAGDDNGALSPAIFDLRGVTFVAWTLAAFAIGALAGTLIRRVIPAMFATIALWAGLAFATGAYLRAHYVAPLLTTNPNVTAPAWVIRQWWTRGGKPASLDMMNHTLGAVDVQALTPGVFQPGPATPANFGDPVHYLIAHGYVLLTRYQPGSRYWPFQWIEAGWLLALSLVLITATVWLVRRRSA